MRAYVWILGAAMLAAPLVMALKSAPATPSPAEPAVAEAAQIAVYDSVDQTWRAPTQSEQEELSQGAAASGELRTFTLPNGGVVAEVGADSMSFLTVEMQPDGTMKMDHMAAADASSLASMPSPRLKNAASTMGGRDEQ